MQPMYRALLQHLDGLYPAALSHTGVAKLRRHPTHSAARLHQPRLPPGDLPWDSGAGAVGHCELQILHPILCSRCLSVAWPAGTS